MNIDECFEQRLLRRGRPDRLKSEKALEMAGRALTQAEKLFEHGFFEQTVLYSYSAMFQGARALLFKDGVFEKSHYCVVEYLRYNYLAKGKLEQKHIHWLDTYRIERHGTFYGLEKVEVSKDDGKMALEAAREFLKPIRKLVAE